MNPLQQFIQSLTQGTPVRLADADLQWIADRYPFFPLPFAIEAAAETNTERRHKLMQRVALAATDPTMLLRLTEPMAQQFAHFYPDREPAATPSTDSAIDTFLATYGHTDPREEALLERLIFNPVPDYSAVLEREAAAENTETHKISANTNKPEPAEKPKKSPSHHTPVSSSLSESLARIFIKQQRYDKAYEIITQLSLNFPEKSVYFADQLRFLQKLIKNRNLLNRENNQIANNKQ